MIDEMMSSMEPSKVIYYNSKRFAFEILPTLLKII